MYKEKTLYNGRESDLLIRLPVKSGNFGEDFHYYPKEMVVAKTQEYIDNLNLYITDESNNTINFYGSNVEYDISFLINE